MATVALANSRPTVRRPKAKTTCAATIAMRELAEHYRSAPDWTNPKNRALLAEYTREERSIFAVAASAPATSQVGIAFMAIVAHMHYPVFSSWGDWPQVACVTMRSLKCDAELQEDYRAMASLQVALALVGACDDPDLALVANKALPFKDDAEQCLANWGMKAADAKAVTQ